MKRLIALLIFLLVLPVVYSIGVSPAEVKINFKPNLETSIGYRLRSNMASAMNVEIQLKGDLAEYATLGSDRVFIEPGKYGYVNVSLNFPAKIEKPGLHTIQFIATEATGTGGPVGARGEVISMIKIFVQFPGKYADASLDARDAKLGKDAEFIVTVNNLGTEKINGAKAVIDIYNGNEKVGTVKTDEKPIDIFGSATLNAKWSTKGQKQGNYRAVATVQYDEKTTTAEDNFMIGVLNVKIIDHTKEVYEKQVNEFNVEVKSEWNDPVENLFADVSVLKDNTELMAFSVSEKTLGPWEIKNLTGYFNTANLQVSSYEISIALSFNELGKNEMHYSYKNGTIDVLKAGETAMTAAGFGRYLTTTNMLIFILILLVIINIIWFWKRRKNEEEEI
jgi:hypothetical protein